MLWSGSGGENGGRYCDVGGSAIIGIWVGGAVVYMGMLGPPVDGSINAAGFE